MRTAPAVFDSDASGGVRVVEEAVGDASGTEIRLAEQLCPVRAILVADAAG